MKQYNIGHKCVFPHAEGVTPRHRTTSYREVELNFGDVIYVVSDMVLHYLDDKECHGWPQGWKPPQDFINRVMRGGTISFHVSLPEKWEVPQIGVGYLDQGEGEFAGKIIDNAHQGDLNERFPKLAEFGDVPEEFIARLKLLREKANEDYDQHHDIYAPYKNTVSVEERKKTLLTVTLPPAPGYEHAECVAHPPRPLDYEGKFKALFCRALERDGMTVWSLEDIEPLESWKGRRVIPPPLNARPYYEYEAYQIAANMVFVRTGQDTAAARITPWAGTHNKTETPERQAYVRQVFTEAGITLDDTEFPLVQVSGENLHKLEKMGAPIKRTWQAAEEYAMSARCR